MKKILAFLRWEFKDCTKSVSFWGAMIAILGGIMALAGCPNPWPIAAVVLGFGMNLADLVYCWIRFRVAMYQLDQEAVARKLQDQ